MHDPRLGRWLSLDPLQAKYAGISPYVFTVDNPIFFLDVKGRDVIQSKDFAANTKASGGLDLVKQTDAEKSFLTQFARVQQTPGAEELNVDVGATKDGLLSRHNVKFGTNTPEQGATNLKIKDSKGQFVDYKGQDFGADAQFEITIDINVMPIDNKYDKSYVLGHESLVHGQVIATALAKFEQAKIDANGDPDKINAALTVLKEEFKAQVPGTPEFAKAENEEHRSIAEGKDFTLQSALTQLKDIVKGEKGAVKKLESIRKQDVEFQQEDVKEYDKSHKK